MCPDIFMNTLNLHEILGIIIYQAYTKMAFDTDMSY